MIILAKVAGRIRGMFSGNAAENRETEQVHLSNRGEQCIAQGLPALTEIVRLGDSWCVMSGGRTPYNALQVSQPGWSLYNGEPSNGKCYVIDSFGLVEITQHTTQQESVALFAMNSAIGSVAAPTDSAHARSSMSGKAYGGRARTVAGGTTVDNGWQPHGVATYGNPTFTGAVWRVNEAQVNGMYVVQPGGQFNIQGVKASSTGSWQLFIRWHEVYLIYKT